MDKEKTTIKMEVNELSKEHNEMPEIKEMKNMIEALMEKCNEKNIPLLCFIDIPETPVDVLAIRGKAIDIIFLIIMAMERIPGFSEMVKRATAYRRHKEMDHADPLSMLRDILGDLKS